VLSSYFEDVSKWDPSIAARARVLLEHLYEVYKADGCASEATAPEVTSTATSIFLDAIRNLTPAQQRAAVTEIEVFFSGAYPCLDGDVLKWWKVGIIVYVLLFFFFFETMFILR
jgi:hypothetical protein